MTDSCNLIRIVRKFNLEIYNLAAQSHVAVSFDSPEYTANVDALGIKILEAVRMLNLTKTAKSIKPVQASFMVL